MTIARYAFGLSKFETRWGTFTDPWTHQSQPKCGFILVGSHGTISSFDYEETIRVQDEAHPQGAPIPVDELPVSSRDPIAYVVDRLKHGGAIEGPLSIAISRIGQQIVDTAYQSARQKRTLALLDSAPSGGTAS